MTDDDKPVEVEPLADEKIFAALGKDVRLIIAEQRDGTLRAYYPAFGAGQGGQSYGKYATVSLISPAAAAVPPAVQTCLNNGWSCNLQGNGSWVCTRMVAGRRYQKTVWP